MDDQKRDVADDGMNTLSQCMSVALERGYTNELAVTAKGLSIAGEEKYYKPEDVRIDTFYRFEGASNPDDMSILYLIETADGMKGTLVDAYGTYADSRINEFIVAVHDIHKTRGAEGA